MARIHPVTLGFGNHGLEQAFHRADLGRARAQGRLAMAVGTLVYLLAGVLDPWLVVPEHRADLWAIRLTALGVPALVFVVSFTPWFARLSNLLLAAVGLAAGAGLIAMQTYLEVGAAAYYYPLLVLATFYTYNFVGTRFVYAVGVDLGLLAAYNLVFGWGLDYPPRVLLTHDFFIVSANLIGGSAGYLAERYRRVLFLRERDIAAERELHMTRSLHDGLTGLPNRDLLHDRIEQAVARAERDGSVHCGYFLDLDGFKAVNDVHGHKAGDGVLREVARRLCGAVRQTDTVARIGGDEFFVLALDVGDEAVAREVAESLVSCFDSSFPVDDAETRLGTSIGLCLFPYPGMTVADLVHRTDQAMYRAKAAGRGGYEVAEVPG